MNEYKNVWVSEMDHNLTDLLIVHWVWKPFHIPTWIDENERRAWEQPLNVLIALNTNQKRNEISNCETSGKTSSHCLKRFDYFSKNRKSCNVAKKIKEKFPHKTSKITHRETQIYTHMHNAHVFNVF